MNKLKFSVSEPKEIFGQKLIMLMEVYFIITKKDFLNTIEGSLNPNEKYYSYFFLLKRVLNALT